MQLPRRRNSRRGRLLPAPWPKKPLRNGRNPCKEFPAKAQRKTQRNLSSLLCSCFAPLRETYAGDRCLERVKSIRVPNRVKSQTISADEASDQPKLPATGSIKPPINANST